MIDGGRRSAARAALVVAALLSCGWTAPTVRHVAWTAVQFFPPDLERQVRKHEQAFDAGLARGLAEREARWRATSGDLAAAVAVQADHCASGLLEPITMAELVERLGVLAVCALDANDPLAVSDADPREPSYATGYRQYVESRLERVRLVYYGQDARLRRGRLASAMEETRTRGVGLYPFVGAEFYRTGELRDWRVFSDLSSTFGVAGVALSRGMTDVANLAAYVWERGGGLVPAPRPTPPGHVGPTVTVGLQGGLPERSEPQRGRAAFGGATLRTEPR